MEQAKNFSAPPYIYFLNIYRWDRLLLNNFIIEHELKYMSCLGDNQIRTTIQEIRWYVNELNKTTKNSLRMKCPKLQNLTTTKKEKESKCLEASWMDNTFMRVKI